MFFTTDHNKLYLSTVKFNIVRVFNALSEIVTADGGRVKPTTPGFIIDRSIYDKMYNLKEQIKRAENAINAGNVNTDIIKNVLENDKKELDALEKAEKEITPTPATQTNYISFVLDGFYYYVSMDENIFGDCTLIKTPVTDNKTTRNAYGATLSKKWFINDLFGTCDAETVKKCALELLEEAKNAPVCKPYIESYKRRVQNTYNNSYHYETIYKKEEFKTLDF